MNTLPAHLQNRRPTGLTASVSQGLSSGAPPYLSIRSQRFTLIDAAGNEKPLQTLYADVVIVQANPTVSRVYYDQPFNPSANEFTPPACFSDNGKAPSSQARAPQSSTCASCPNAVWGSEVSKVTGKGIPACNQVKKLAIVMADNPDMPFLLRIPPNSLKHLSAYVKTIAAQSAGTRQVEVSDIVTRISFDPQVQGTLNFSAVGWVDERTVAVVDRIWEANAADDLVGLNDQPYQGRIALAGPGAQQAPQGQLPPPPAPPVQAGGSLYNAPPMQTVPSVPSAASAPTPGNGAPSAAPRGRGRPKKDAAPAPPQPAFMQQASANPPPAQERPDFGAQAAQANGIPDFLRRDQPAPADNPGAPAKPQFGMVAAAPGPSAELSAALDKAMNLPLPGAR